MGDTYNVFISWSGERSKAAAEALRGWLRRVLQAARPWMSETDIDKGSRGLEEIGRALEGIKVGIICLTPENLNAPWILYEAGALSKTLDAKTRVCTYLLGGLRSEDVTGPLSMFQWTKAEREDTRKLLRAVNKALDGSLVPENDLDDLFEGMWPKLEKELAALPMVGGPAAPRPEREMVAEILDLTRAAAQSRKAVEPLDEYIPTYMQLMPALAKIAPLLTEAIKAAPKQVTTTARKTFLVKLSDDPQIKRIEGINAHDDGSGNLFVLDDGGRILARFANVEQWWPETLAETSPETEADRLLTIAAVTRSHDSENK